LKDAKKNREPEERTAPSAISAGFGTRDKCDDRIVESEDADLAHEICRGPGNGKNAESGWAEQARDEEGEDAPEIRGEHRDEVGPSAAFQFRAGIDPMNNAAGRRNRPQDGFGGSHETSAAATRFIGGRAGDCR
jgi:hypothetical protein